MSRVAGDAGGALRLFDRASFRALVLYCGAYQAGHVAVNLGYLLGLSTGFPPPPPGGWRAQTHFVFGGIGLADSIGAAISLVFVAAFFARRAWSFALGLIPLSGLLLGTVTFVYFARASGAWAADPLTYWGVLVVSLPLFALGVWIAMELSREPALRRPATLREEPGA